MSTRYTAVVLRCAATAVTAFLLVAETNVEAPVQESMPLAQSVKRGFIGYAEAGSPRKHQPWLSFADAKDLGAPFRAWPANFNALPLVAFVAPDENHNMHDGSVAQADSWLKQNLDPYISWSKDNHGIFILTFDEDNGTEANLVPCIVVGDGIKPGGVYSGNFNHYSTLAAIEDAFGLERLEKAADALPLVLPTEKPEHIVLTIMENQSYGAIVGNFEEAPYVNSLIAQGTLFTGYSAVGHPSQPNYLALFTGSTHGIKDNGVYNLNEPSLAGQLSALLRARAK